MGTIRYFWGLLLSSLLEGNAVKHWTNPGTLSDNAFPAFCLCLDRVIHRLEHNGQPVYTLGTNTNIFSSQVRHVGLADEMSGRLTRLSTKSVRGQGGGTASSSSLFCFL